MRSALLVLFTIATVLSVAVPGDAARTAPPDGQSVAEVTAKSTGVVEQARLICGWYGYFECVRVCPSRARLDRYCRPAIYGLPWV
jgi:hypothetical protein